MSEILKLWKLRTHPFRPRVDSKGDPFPEMKQFVTTDFLLDTLDPKVDKRFINFYYDFYGWTEDQLVYRISRKDEELFEKFPKPTDLKEPKSLLIINQGLEGHGLKSLRNLILHKIRLESGDEPIVVTLKLDGRNHAANVMAVARNFRDAYADAGEDKPTTADLEKIYDQETKAPATGSQSVYQNLFTRTNERVRKFCRNPLVLLLECEPNSSGEEYDAWQVLYNSTSPLFQYILVVTRRLDNATTVNTIFLRDEKNVALIVSHDLGLDDARKYLLARLADQRNSPQDSANALEPFTENALQELFLPGKAVSRPTPEKRFKIFELNRTFTYALDFQASKLESRDLSRIDPKDALIGSDTIMEVRELINNGKKRPIPATL